MAFKHFGTNDRSTVLDNITASDESQTYHYGPRQHPLAVSIQTTTSQSYVIFKLSLKSICGQGPKKARGRQNLCNIFPCIQNIELN